MLPLSLGILLMAILLVFVGLAALALALWLGQFEDLDQQATVILDKRDYQLERPWESPAQRSDRSARHGPLTRPDPGEWGGAE